MIGLNAIKTGNSLQTMIRMRRTLFTDATRRMYTTRAAFQQQTASSQGYDYQEFSQLSESYMKIVGSEVDTLSQDYLQNYE